MPMKNFTIKMVLMSLLALASLGLYAQAPVPPTNDDVCNAIDVPDDGIGIFMAVDTATFQVGEDAITPPLDGGCEFNSWCDNGIDASVWFKFTAPASGAVDVSICGSSYDTQLAVYSVGDCNDFSTFAFIDGSDDSPTGTPGATCGPEDTNIPGYGLASEVHLECLTAGAVYYVLVDEWSANGATAGGLLDIKVTETAAMATGVAISDTLTFAPTCAGGNDGAVAIDYSGTYPYTFEWSTGSTDYFTVGLSEGETVSVTITDFCGTSAIAEATVPVTPIATPITIVELAAQAAYCGMGYASLEIGGGTPPYEVVWSNGVQGVFSWLEKGDYTVSITDQCGDATTSSVTIDGLADAGPDVMMGCGPSTLGGAPTGSAVVLDNSITYSLDQSIEGIVACRSQDPSPPYISDNGYYRVFDLANDFGITTDYTIDEIEIAISFAFSNSSSGLQPLECRVFEVDNANLGVANFTPVDTIKVNLPQIDTAQFFSFPINYTIQANQLIAIEIWNPRGADDGNFLSIGANESATLNNSTTWLRSEGCVLTTPTPVSAIGFMDQMIVNLVQYGAYSGGYTYQWSPTTGLDDSTAANPMLTLEEPAGVIDYTVVVTDDNGCSATSTVSVDATEAGVPGDAGTLAGGGGACYNGILTATEATAPTIPAGNSQMYALTQGSTLTIVGLSATPSFDLSAIDFATLGVPDCGDFTIHSFVYTDISDLSGVVLGTTTGVDVAGWIGSGALCASIDVLGAPFMVACSDVDIMTSSTVENCGLSDGSATATVSGGTAPYTYLWSDGQTAATASGLTSGAYSLVATDANGCTASTTANVGNSAGLTASGVVTNVSCNGEASGAIDLMPSGGTMPYTFNWSNGATTEDLAGLGAGSYSGTVTDANGCTFVGTVEITEPTALAGATVSTDASCNGVADGEASVSASGGTAPYTYAWSNGGTSASLAGLGAGTYTGTVTDANGCMLVASATVGEPSAIIATTVVTDEMEGDMMGAIDLTVSGGTAPYTFAWSNGATTEDLAGLVGGDYTGTVTDANGCTAVSGPHTVVNIVSAIEDIEGLNALNIQPNPTSGNVSINIALDKQMQVRLDVFSVAGQLVRSFENATITNKQYELDLSANADGVYFARFTIDGQTITERIVLMK